MAFTGNLGATVDRLAHRSNAPLPNVRVVARVDTGIRLVLWE